MLPFNYRTALYRKDSNGNINVWQAIPQDVCTIHIFHGRLDGTIIEEYIKTHRVPADDIRSRKDAKRKTGYKFLNELKDNIELPNEAGLMQFLEDCLLKILLHLSFNQEKVLIGIVLMTLQTNLN